jgi:CDP-glycerol glycerophosphotransferase (TagB/SpsB family)
MTKNSIARAIYYKKYRIKNKETIRERNKKYNEDNKEIIAIKKKKYYLDNREKILTRNKTYNKLNRAKVAKTEAKWRHNNKGRVASNIRRYQISKIKRTPKWLTKDDLWLIKEAYELAAIRTKLFGYPWHVDHIIPLNGKTVSGLHVIKNLQVIPGVENFTKKNKYEIENGI